MKEIHIRDAGKDGINHLTVSTPGRICLFGEHQDYLHLPVIPAAISLRVAIEGIRRPDQEVRIRLPDINAEEKFSLAGPLEYKRERDYFRSTVNVLRRAGLTFSTGFDCVVHGNIPINAGTSSSSALVVSWVNFLARMCDQRQTLSAEQYARYAVEAEVLEFHEPGGMMDQFTTAIGGLLSIDFHPEVKADRIDAILGTFVLGDSGEAKNTKLILARVKNRVLDIVKRLTRDSPDFTLHTLTMEGLDQWKDALDSGQFALMAGTVRNHMITREARRLLAQHPLDHRRLGSLLDEHQTVLREVLEISTPKIDAMLDAALEAGAYGGKINGSGGGGCMFAYSPENPEFVAEAIRRAGGKAYVVSVDAGTRVDAEDAGRLWTR
jgi:galactokinase